MQEIKYGLIPVLYIWKYFVDNWIVGASEPKTKLQYKYLNEVALHVNIFLIRRHLISRLHVHT